MARKVARHLVEGQAHFFWRAVDAKQLDERQAKPGSRAILWGMWNYMCAASPWPLVNQHVAAMGAEQCNDSRTHLLTALILRCATLGAFTQDDLMRCVKMLRILFANAHPDGSGVDLTAGTPKLGFLTAPTYIPCGVSIAEMWPNSEYSGPLVLVSTLSRGWVHLPDRVESAREAYVCLQSIRQELLSTMQSIRRYRHTLQSVLADPLRSGNVHARDLHTLVAAHLLLPLQNESYLEHPLITGSTSN
jgi:hypothetical protein